MDVRVLGRDAGNPHRPPDPLTPRHCQTLDLHSRTRREPASGHRGARGRILREIRRIHSIHRSVVLDVREEHRALHRAVERASSRSGGLRRQFAERAEPRVDPRTWGAAFHDTSGQASTSAGPPAALARNAVPAPYRWNTAPTATPPIKAANPVMPWYAPNPLPWC